MSPNVSAPALSPTLRLRLSVMMFLQYAIWGAWLPFLWSFLSEHRKLPADQIGSLFAAGAVGAILGPFIAGQVADRYFNTEKFLGLSHLIGAVLIWQLAEVESFQSFLIFSLTYGLVYSPTLALTNSLAFHHLPDRDRDFGKVRMWGTFGWIVVGIAMGHWLGYAHTPQGADAATAHLEQVAGKADAFRLSAVLGVLMGLYCFSLPSTPPSKSAKGNAVFAALGEVQRQPLMTLFLLAVPVSCIHQFYFVHTEGFLHAKLEVPEFFRTIFGVGGGGFMTIGQMVEVAVLGLIPLVAKRASRKSLLAVGLAAYTLRMALFAYMQNSGLVLLFGVGLHGLCFGCFIFVAFMIVDEETSPDVRASAQNLFNLVIIGVGIIVGSWIAGLVAKWAGESGTMDYTRLFSVPMYAAFACFWWLVLFYPGKPAAHDSRIT
jgi:nucleoside transporter